MRICFLSCFPYPGTSSTAYYSYSQELRRQGSEVTVLSAYLAPSSRWGLERDRVNGVNVYRLPVTTFSKTSLASTLFALTAFRLLDNLHRQQPFDVLQLQAFPNLGLILYPTGRTPDVTVLDIRTSAVSRGFLNAVSKIVLRFQARLFRHVSVLDPHLTDFLFGSDRDKVTTIPLGASFRAFRPGEAQPLRHQLGFAGDDLVMIYTGNMDRVRTIDKLVLAFAGIAERYPQARLVLVGSGDQIPHLQSLVKERDLSDRLKFTGIVPYSQVPRYLRAADIGLAYVADKVQYRNQPPLKTVEYLASGLPVVATDTPGNRRFVRHGQNGLLVPDSVETLARGLCELAERRDARLSMAREARNSVRRFSYEYIVREQMLPFYQRCLEET